MPLRLHTIVLGLALSAWLQSAPATRALALQGPDHIPIAVRDLEAAAARYRSLGFVLKPGTFHANGIRNQHAKFADGTELELITAPEARDALTTTYRQHLEKGDGPAFLALHAPSAAQLADRLDASGVGYRRVQGRVDFDNTDALGYIFFGRLNRSPTDRPEHFAHPNGAEALIAVWLAGDDLSRERALLQAAGATIDRQTVNAPIAIMATVAHLPDGDVVLLPGSHQLVAGRRIIGATVRVKSAAAVRTLLAANGLSPHRVSSGAGHTSIFLPPTMTHGLWLELREEKRAGG